MSLKKNILSILLLSVLYLPSIWAMDAEEKEAEEAAKVMRARIDEHMRKKLAKGEITEDAMGRYEQEEKEAEEVAKAMKARIELRKKELAEGGKDVEQQYEDALSKYEQEEKEAEEAAKAMKAKIERRKKELAEKIEKGELPKPLPLTEEEKLLIVEKNKELIKQTY